MSISLTSDAKEQLNYLSDRYSQERFSKYFVLKKQIYHKEIANKLADISPNTIRNYFKEYLSVGLERLALNKTRSL